MVLRIHPSIASNQNLIIEKLTHEAISMYGIDVKYIPRTLVNEDKLLGEDRLSKFEHAYPLIAYIESSDGFQGQGAWASKFGLQQEQSLIVQISKKGWGDCVGKYNTAPLPNRPSEGDLVWFPLPLGSAGSLMEIMYVDNQNPFFQLGQSYSYKLTLENFRYSSERISTEDLNIDVFESKLSMDTALTPADKVDVKANTRPNNEELRQRAKEISFNTGNPFGEL